MPETEAPLCTTCGSAVTEDGQSLYYFDAVVPLAELREENERLIAALAEIKTEAGGNSGENTYKMNGRLLRILNTADRALRGKPSREALALPDKDERGS